MLQEEADGSQPLHEAGSFVLTRDGLKDLFAVLETQGYTTVGPTLRDGAVILDELDGPDDLPWGWTDDQEAAVYRVEQDGKAGFHFTQGPQSFKKYLYPPQARLWQATRKGRSFEVIENDAPRPRYAFIGVRACDIAAIDVLDRVFERGDYPDPEYQSRRAGALVIAVNCSKAGQTCFCVSMNTGPKATAGFDIALTELADGDDHVFVLETGSDRGEAIAAELSLERSDDTQRTAADTVVQRTVDQMGRSLDTSDLPAKILANLEHPHWDDVAARCLTCANCTMVCPTCFCSTVEEKLDLDGSHAERWRTWDSCFTHDFSYTAGGVLRQSGGSRYRQWLTHKLSTWVDQFDTFGCVGCGRCITWCPVGIDITKEAVAVTAAVPARGDGS